MAYVPSPIQYKVNKHGISIEASLSDLISRAASDIRILKTWSDEKDEPERSSYWLEK